MRSLSAERNLRTATVYALACGLVMLRAAVWIVFEQSHFDSDQAVVGLMAKHLAEGRAFPLFFYGQHYMLAVEAWLAAPVFKVMGPSVATLKLPLLAINLGVACLLLWILMNRMALPAWQAFATAIFFILPPPLTSAHLVEAQGSNIEPFLYVLILWLLRDRPIVFGLFAGFAFLHREFTLYAIIALVMLDAVTGRLFSRARLRDYTVAWGMAALVVLATSLVKTRSDFLGPGTAGTSNLGGLDTQLSSWSGLLCWPPSDLGWNVQWLLKENLGMIFNWRPDLLGPGGWTPVPAGHPWLVFVLAMMAAIAIGHAVHGRRQIGPRWEFGTYLMAIGIQSAVAYVVIGCYVRDASLLRYTLLTLYFPVGLITLFFSSGPHPRLRGLMLVLTAVWAACSLADNVRFLAAYIHHPAPAPYRELANYLESQGVRYGRAQYWTAYQVDFLTRERVTLASSEKVRVAEYQRMVDQHDKEAIRILPERDGCPSGVPFRQWCFENLDGARGLARTR